MQRIVHIATLSLVLYHALVGCCGHHAHAGHPERADEQIDCVACCCHHHDHAEPYQPAENHDGHGGGCDGENCDFVVPQTDTGVELADLTDPAHGLCVPVICDMPATAELVAHESPPPTGLPPLRLHLVNQILLI